MKSSTIKKVFMCVICAAMVTVSALPIVGAQDAESSETGITKIFYRDYEDYTGGIGYMSIESDNGKYGTATMSKALSGSFNNAAASVQGINGKGVCFTKCTTATQSSAVNLNFNTEITSGQLYTAFDMTVNPNATKNFIIKTLNTSDVQSGFFGVSGEATESYEKFQVFRAADSSSWNGNKIDNVVLESGKTYKIEITANVSSDGTTYNYYIDGVLVGGPYVQSVTSVKGFTMEISNLLDYFDTFTIMHYPNGVVNDSNIIAVSAIDNTDDKKIKVNFRDSAMGFGTVMPNFDKDKVTVKAKNGSPINVSGVTSGEKTGEYIIELETTPSNGEYLIEFANDLTDTVGRTLVNLTDSSFLTATVVKDGNTAAVKYNSAKEYTGLVLWAAYSDGILVATNVQPINTAEGNNLSVSVPNEYTNVTYKIYIWNDCMQPVGSYNN